MIPRRFVLLVTLFLVTLSYIQASISPSNLSLVRRAVNGHKPKALGQACKKNSDCSSKTCSSKKKCIRSLLPNGKKCAQDKTCASGNCEKKKCAAKKGLKASCTKSANCKSGFCNAKYKCAAKKAITTSSSSSTTSKSVTPIRIGVGSTTMSASTTSTSNLSSSSSTKSTGTTTTATATSTHTKLPTSTTARYAATSSTSMDVPAASQTLPASSGGAGSRAQLFSYAGDVKRSEGVVGGPQRMDGSTSFLQTTVTPGHPAYIQLTSAPAQNNMRKRDVEAAYYNTGFSFNIYKYSGAAAKDQCTVAIVIDGVAVEWRQIDSSYTDIDTYKSLSYYIANYYAADQPVFGAIVACYGAAEAEVLFDGIIWEQVAPDSTSTTSTKTTSTSSSSTKTGATSSTTTGTSTSATSTTTSATPTVTRIGVNTSTTTSTTSTTSTTTTITSNPAPSGMRPRAATDPAIVPRGIYKRFGFVMKTRPYAAPLRARDGY